MKIRIRPITVEDTNLIVKWRNNPAVMTNFIYQKELTEEEHINWLYTKVFNGDTKQFIIEEIATDKRIGSVYIRDIDINHHKGEFGIFIGEDSARGKGYGTMATVQLLRYAFESLELNRVFLRVFADNPSAIACYKKAGFTEEGIAREDVWINNVPRDIVFMSVLKSQWREECEND